MLKKLTALFCAAVMSAALLSPFACADSTGKLTEKDGKIYYMDGDKFITGWQEIGGNRYFFKKTGEAVTKSTVIGGIRYKFSSDGICRGKYTGWSKSGDKKYYYSNGIKAKGWTKMNDSWHYFDDSDGSHAAGSANIYGKTYNFSSSGVWDGIADDDYRNFYRSVEKNLSKDDYGGLYFDKNVLVIMSRNDKSVKKLTEKLKDSCYTPFIVKHCKFSVNDLEKVRKHISQNMKKYGIAAISTDIMNNRIEVEIPKDNKKLSDYISSLDDSDIVYIKYGDGVIVED